MNSGLLWSSLPPNLTLEEMAKVLLPKWMTRTLNEFTGNLGGTLVSDFPWALSHSALSPMLSQFVERRTVRVAFARALIVKAAVGPRLRIIQVATTLTRTGTHPPRLGFPRRSAGSHSSRCSAISPGVTQPRSTDRRSGPSQRQAWCISWRYAIGHDFQIAPRRLDAYKRRVTFYEIIVRVVPIPLS
jgi:hypothetical protein